VKEMEMAVGAKWPMTSWLGEYDNLERRVPQRMRLLAEFVRHPEGLTNYEAGVQAGLPPTSAYWMRCSELLDDGLIEIVYDMDTYKEITRKNPATGSAQRVCVVTDRGRAVFKEYVESKK
jgi:hypothetical protein